MSKDTVTPWYNPEEAIEPHILAKLDPQFVTIFTEFMNKTPMPKQADWTIENIRADPMKLAPQCALDTKGYPRTAEREVPSEDGAKIPVRVYYPEASKYGPGPYPVHLNFHGGGFVLGGLWSESTLCQSMCDGAGVVVIDVNYRHCPETLWGKNFQDSFAALKWAREEATSLNIKPDSISLGGISAGAHTTLILQILARDANIPLRLAMPTVPCTTSALTYQEPTDSPYPSFREFAKGPVLPWASIRFFGSLAIPEDKRAELHALWPDWWFALDTRETKDLQGLCPTFVRTGECDPLCDEGEAYAFKLARAGNKVTIKRYLGAVHTFMYWPALKSKQTYDQESIQALRDAHGTWGNVTPETTSQSWVKWLFSIFGR